MMKNFVTVDTGICFSLFLLSHVGGLLEADYFIQNLVEPSMCVEGGSIESSDSGPLYFRGQIGGGRCQNKPEQQWHFQQYQPPQLPSIKIGRTSLLFNITSAASETHYSSQLNANMSGLFINYWPNPLTLIPVGNHTRRGNGNLYMIKGSGEDNCFQSAGKMKKLKLYPCRMDSGRQIWRLLLVTFGEISW